MKQIVRDIFIILQRREKSKLWLLAMADVLISILDIGFLIALLYVVNFYTRSDLHAVGSGSFLIPVFGKFPALMITSFFLLFSAKNVFAFFFSKKQYRFVYDVASRISKEKLAQFLDGSYVDYVNIDSSVVNRSISQEPIEFAHYVLNGMQQVFSQLVLVIITTIVVLVFNPLLFPLLLLILAPPVFLVSFLMKQKLDAARFHGKKTSEKAIQHLQEALSGFVESNLYKKNDFFISRYYRQQAQLNHYLSERLIIQNMPPRLIEVFAVFGLMMLIMINLLTHHANTIPLVTIGALMVAAYKIIPGIVKITNSIGQVKTYSFAAVGLATVAKLPVKIAQQPEAETNIALNNVCFSYPDKQILKSLSFTIERGQFAILFAASGRGKTTLINLLLGFLTEDEGDICINGKKTDAIERQRYWPKIAYVRQQPFFLHASINENISLQEHDYDKAKIEKIALQTGINTFAHSFPGGLETLITENGKNFSGGQRQRINFARALYKDFDFLILDEPFNELDELSELAMLRELQKIAATGKMVLLITHNKIALDFCNKKIVMNE